MKTVRFEEKETPVANVNGSYYVLSNIGVAVGS
jgi:hypothetical protein